MLFSTYKNVKKPRPMKQILLFLILVPTFVFSQYNVAYTVTIKRLKANADDCDGGAPFCLNAPQDPVFNIWTSDGEANSNTNCWIFEDDDAAGYGQWIDIQNVEIANETGVNTNYISFDMSGFETDALFAAGCSSSAGDDANYSQQFVQQFDLSTIPQGIPYTDEIDLSGVYFAEIEINWTDLNVGLHNLESRVQFTMAPNPTEGFFNINLSEEGASNFEVSILDISGRTVYSAMSSSNEMTIELSNQESGMYFVNINVD